MRKRRVRLHLVSGDADLPSIEGLLLRRFPEYLIAVPALVRADPMPPAELGARQVAIPRSRVAFYERL